MLYVEATMSAAVEDEVESKEYRSAFGLSFACNG